MKPTWKLTDEQKTQVADRYAAGEKVEAIASLFGVANGSVLSIARTRGLPPRRPARVADAS